MADVEAHQQPPDSVPLREHVLLMDRVSRLQQDHDDNKTAIKELSDRVDRLTLSLIGFVLTLTVFGLGIAVTLLTARR